MPGCTKSPRRATRVVGRCANARIKHLKHIPVGLAAALQLPGPQVMSGGSLQGGMA